MTRCTCCNGLILDRVPGLGLQERADGTYFELVNCPGCHSTVGRNLSKLDEKLAAVRPVYGPHCSTWDGEHTIWPAEGHHCDRCGRVWIFGEPTSCPHGVLAVTLVYATRDRRHRLVDVHRTAFEALVALGRSEIVTALHFSTAGSENDQAAPAAE